MTNAEAPGLRSDVGVFVTANYSLQPEGGGVQRCTREYLALLRAAGIALEIEGYSFDQAPLSRLRRKYFARPYRDLLPPNLPERVIRRARATGARWVFINQTEAGPIIPALAPLQAEGVRIVLLSHGPDSSDYLHEARIRAEVEGGGKISRGDAAWLGAQLFAELHHHQPCDLVFCLSVNDQNAERWLGARRVHWLPRTVEAEPLSWAPIADRIGTVGTLDHAPNVEGILEFCRTLEAVSPGSLRLRLVGRPTDAGQRIADRFPFVDYLGGLNDAEFQAEAASWCAFINPIFCYARGASTKLAVPLIWGLPVASTRAGARGFFWDEALVPLADTPAELVQFARQLADPARAALVRDAILGLVARSPRLADVAASVRERLEQLLR